MNALSGALEEKIAGRFIQVHQLAESLFCPRAGVIALEKNDEDFGEESDERAPRLDYLPDYDIAIIEEDLDIRWAIMKRFLTWLPVGLLVIMIVAVAISWRFAIFVGVPGVVFVPWHYRNFRAITILERRRREAMAAVARMPDPLSNEVQSFNWWTLRKAGFQLCRPRDAHKNRALQLVGRPWGILQFESLRIPVFFKRRGKRELHRQHFARIAAYCYLIEKEEGGQAPYGVVLFADSYEVLIVPNNQAAKETFQKGLELCRQLLAEYAGEPDSPDKPPTTFCKGCHLGKPRVHKNGETETILGRVALPVLGTKGEDGRIYHSICGDRFRWVPPHERAAEKGLLD